MSNACYKVEVRSEDDELATVTPDMVLFRKFENIFVDKRIETIIFESMSKKDPKGPKLFF